MPERHEVLLIDRRYSGAQPATETLTLPFELRQKSRLRCRLDSGDEVGLVLERGIVLRGGDKLQAADGRIVAVAAAPELLSVVATRDPLMLARAAYHLGNRHVAVQLAADALRFLHDHVLDDMLRGLGLPVRVATLPFEPEGGAYGRHEHAHDPRHIHAPDHGHAHHG